MKIIQAATLETELARREVLSVTMAKNTNT